MNGHDFTSSLILLFLVSCQTNECDDDDVDDKRFDSREVKKR